MVKDMSPVITRKRLFAPGCALWLYKPGLAERLGRFLAGEPGGAELSLTCCKNQPAIEAGTEVVNVCPGCDKRYRNNYPDASTVSIWEVLAESETFPFPDYDGSEMSINDACPTRERTGVHDAVRTLLVRMNIRVVEPERTRTHGICCGDSFYGEIPTDDMKRLMAKRASEMPAEDVVVYCVSCAKAMFIGGKRPRYLVDLLFGEGTVPGTLDPDAWHKELDDFILGP
ncbi:MAG TPA: (Fe-S)-binding protein [Acidobacteriota bacterium]|nr:(Fe-S)-binding protein [Acidobacteriota bacterium]